jgi:hypothetical protein
MAVVMVEGIWGTYLVAAGKVCLEQIDFWYFQLRTGKANPRPFLFLFLFLLLLYLRLASSVPVAVVVVVVLVALPSLIKS